MPFCTPVITFLMEALPISQPIGFSLWTHMPKCNSSQGQGSTGIKKDGQSKKTTQLRQWWLAADMGPLCQEDKREFLGLGDWKYLVYLKTAATTQLLWPYDQEKGQFGVTRSFYCFKEKPETWNFTWLLNIDQLFRPNKIGLWVGLSHWTLIFEPSFRYFFPPQTNPFWTVFFKKLNPLKAQLTSCPFPA